MERLPLLFTFKDKVSGAGFLADIEAKGRMLAVKEAERDYWMYGVVPGGLSACGENGGDAYLEFREAYRGVLYDIAEEAADLQDFRQKVEAFFYEASEDTQKEWWEAVEQVRREGYELENLPKRDAGAKPEIRVSRVEKFSTKDNVLEPKRAVAA